MCKKCGCNTCETESTMLVLNESKAPATILSEGLKHHIDTNKPLTEHLYRAGSRAYFDLFAEARSLYSRGILEFTHEDDVALLTETNLGHFGLYETVNFEGEEYDIISKDGDWVYLRSIHDTQVGRKEIKVKEKDITINETKVPLDFPIELNDQMDIYDDVANMEFGMDYDQLGSNEKEWVRDEIDNMSINEEVEIKKSIKDIEDGDVILYKGKKFKVDYIDPWSAGGRILNLTDLKSSKKGKLKVKFVTPKGNTGTASDTMLTVLKESLNEGPIDRVIGGRPYEYVGDGRKGKAIISGPMKDREKGDIIKRAEKAGYIAKPNMGGGVTIFIESVNEGFYSSPSDLEDSGLNVIPKDQIHANKLQDALEDSGLYGEWNPREGYFFFPEKEDGYDQLEMAIQELMDDYNIQGYIEGVFEESLNENNLLRNVYFYLLLLHLRL